MTAPDIMDFAVPTAPLPAGLAVADGMLAAAVRTGLPSTSGYAVMQAVTPDEGKQTILLVEDDLLIRLTTADYLESCGYIVLQAEDAAEAVIWFDSEIVDLVFTDLQMPGAMDGSGLALWVMVHHPAVPVIITSGVLLDCEHGIGPMIRKPYDLDAVHLRIQDALRKTA